jgi:hypothetical protein
LQLEIEMRVAAEQRVQALENKFKSELEMDWTRFKADIEQAEAAVKAREEAIAQTSDEEASRHPENLVQQLYDRLEAERQARYVIERKLKESESGAENEKAKFNFDAERKLAELEAALKEAIVSRAEAERKLAEFMNGYTGAKASSGLSNRKPSAPNPSAAAWRLSMALGLGRAMSKKNQIGLVGYGVAALLLAVALFFLLYLGLKAII